MKYFKVDGHTFAYEADGSQDHLIPAGAVPLTEDEVSALFPAVTKPTAADTTRAARDELLAKCDWTMVADAPLTAAQKQSWAIYRVQLRNVPQQTGFPTDISWPTPPGGSV